MSSFIFESSKESSGRTLQFDERNNFTLFQDMFSDMLPTETLELIWLSVAETSNEAIFNRAVDSALLILQDEEELSPCLYDEVEVDVKSCRPVPSEACEEDAIFESSFSSLSEENQLSALRLIELFDGVRDISRGALLAILSEYNFNVDDALAAVFYMLNPKVNEEFNSVAEYNMSNPLPSQAHKKQNNSNKNKAKSLSRSDRSSYAGIVKEKQPPINRYSRRTDPLSDTEEQYVSTDRATNIIEVHEWPGGVNVEHIWRKQAAEHANQMKSQFRLAASTYHSKTNGPLALTIALSGRSSQQQMMSCHANAALAAVSSRNPSYLFGLDKDTKKLAFLGPKKSPHDSYDLCTSDRVQRKCASFDLHGLYVKEAIQAVESILNYYSNTSPNCMNTLNLIVGRGNNSQGNKPKLGPSVCRYMESKGYRCSRSDAEIKIKLS